MMAPLVPVTMLRPRRAILGISATLLPFTANGTEIDWQAFSDHLLRTVAAGLTPAVNMDTGFVNLLTEWQRMEVLKKTRETLKNHPFFAGAFVADHPGDTFALDAYLRQIDPILSVGATPVIFQSYGLVAQADSEIVESYSRIGRSCARFIGFELGEMFAPFGKIYSLEVFRCLINVRECIGIKHSSLNRELEWLRLQLKNQIRPEFHVFTGNDLAIDMVMYGSDYLLGVSTLAPDLFAIRDNFWQKGDPAFYELNDVLQYLGFLAFRDPVPAYKHSAAMFLKLRGWLDSDATHPQSPTRPDSDRELLRDIGRKLGKFAPIGI